MTLEEIKQAVDAGKTVHWATPAYTVVHDVLKDGEDQWLIHCTFNDSFIGLTWRDGVTLNGKPEQFYIEGEQPQPKSAWAAARPAPRRLGRRVDLDARWEDWT